MRQPAARPEHRDKVIIGTLTVATTEAAAAWDGDIATTGNGPVESCARTVAAVGTGLIGG